MKLFTECLIYCHSVNVLCLTALLFIPGTYAFRLPDDDGEHGIWVGYEDPDTAGNKASYVKAKGLGGVSINDLSLDDFRGLCTGDKYPILRAAKFRL